MLQAHVRTDHVLKIMDWFSYRTWNTQSGVRGDEWSFRCFVGLLFNCVACISISRSRHGFFQGEEEKREWKRG